MSEKVPRSVRDGLASPRPGPAPAGARPSAGVYLSWGGQIYGPSTREEVRAGIRTSWFEDGALYWHEGLEDWKPVAEFPVSSAEEEGKMRAAALPAAPALPSTTGGTNRGGRGRRARSSKPSSSRLGRRGRAMFLIFSLLAVLLTVGVLLLLMLI